MNQHKRSSIRQWVGAAACAAVAFTGLPAHAQEAQPSDLPVLDVTSTYENSININPIMALFGSYSVNYERLFDKQHGLLVEGGFSMDEDGVTSTLSYGLGVGYRWHWSKTQDSGFVGANLGFETGSAETFVNGERFDLTLTAPYFVFNIGRRWAWDGGFNITLRGGVGRAFYSVSSDSDNPDVQDAIAAAEEVLNWIPIRLDGELSVGFCF